MQKINIYSTPSCSYCKLAKDFMSEKGIKFEEFNVATDLARRQEMFDKSGQMGVPVITVGEEVIVGYDRDYLAEKLGVTA